MHKKSFLTMFDKSTKEDQKKKEEKEMEKLESIN